MEPREEPEEDAYLSPGPVCPRLDGLSVDQVRILRRRMAYNCVSAELARRRAEPWARVLGRPR